MASEDLPEYLPEFDNNEMPLANSSGPATKKVGSGLSQSEFSQLMYREIKDIIKRIKNALIITNLDHNLIHFFCSVHSIYNDLLQIRKKLGDEEFFKSNEVLFLVYYIIVVRLIDAIRNSKLDNEIKSGEIKLAVAKTIADIYDSDLFFKDDIKKDIKKNETVDNLLERFNKDILKNTNTESEYSKEPFKQFTALMKAEAPSTATANSAPASTSSTSAASASTSAAPASTSAAPASTSARADPRQLPQLEITVDDKTTTGPNTEGPIWVLGIDSRDDDDLILNQLGCTYVAKVRIDSDLYNNGILNGVPFGIYKINDEDVSEAAITTIINKIETAYKIPTSPLKLTLVFKNTTDKEEASLDIQKVAFAASAAPASTSAPPVSTSAAPASSASTSAAVDPNTLPQLEYTISLKDSIILGIIEETNPNVLDKFGCRYVAKELIPDKILAQMGFTAPFGVYKVNDIDVSKITAVEVRKKINAEKTKSDQVKLTLVYLTEAAKKASQASITAATNPAAVKYPVVFNVPPGSALGINETSTNQVQINNFGCSYVVTKLSKSTQNKEKYLNQIGIKVPFGISKVDGTDVSKIKINEIEKLFIEKQSQGFELTLIYLDENLQKASLKAINPQPPAPPAAAAPPQSFMKVDPAAEKAWKAKSKLEIASELGRIKNAIEKTEDMTALKSTLDTFNNKSNAEVKAAEVAAIARIIKYVDEWNNPQNGTKRAENQIIKWKDNRILINTDVDATRQNNITAANEILNFINYGKTRFGFNRFAVGGSRKNTRSSRKSSTKKTRKHRY